MQVMAWARPLAWLRAGSNNPARMAITAITTSSSMRVKAPGLLVSTGVISGSMRDRTSFDVHDGFDDAGLRLHPFGKLANHFLEAGMMGNPRARVDLPAFNQLDDAGEIGRQG